MNRKHRKISFLHYLAIVLLGIALIFSAKAYFKQQIGPVNVQESNSVTVEISKGASTAFIARELKNKDVIKNDLAFRVLSKLSKADGKMQAGKYEFTKNLSAEQIINKLVNGEVTKNTLKFTIPEGFEFHQIVDRLDSKGFIHRDIFVDLANNEDFNYRFLKNIPKGENRLEGFLFPDTYEIAPGTTEKEILEKMLGRFDKIFEEQYYRRAEELKMSVREVITLASIIEREAKLDSERPIVSSVFHNRLFKDMLIQSCATVQYVLGERKENLSLKDISIDSPYNTYKHSGLPPAPIASPGKASIEAALYPQETDYLYFVVQKNGQHAFSKTYEEHKKAKNGN